MVGKLKAAAKAVRKAVGVKPVGQRRFELLIKKMKALGDESSHFDMQVWFSHNGDVSVESVHGKALGELTDYEDCGTAACAFGWACTIPSFRKAGLKLATSPLVVPAFEMKDGMAAATAFFQNRYMGYIFRPVRDEFGIPQLETPKEWVARAEKWLKQHKAYFRA